MRVRLNGASRHSHRKRDREGARRREGGATALRRRRDASRATCAGASTPAMNRSTPAMNRSTPAMNHHGAHEVTRRRSIIFGRRLRDSLWPAAPRSIGRPPSIPTDQRHEVPVGVENPKPCRNPEASLVLPLRQPEEQDHAARRDRRALAGRTPRVSRSASNARSAAFTDAESGNACATSSSSARRLVVSCARRFAS